jgi:hypothetical protein
MRSKTISIAAIVLSVRHAAAEEPFGAAAGSWAFYGGDAGGSRYSPFQKQALWVRLGGWNLAGMHVWNGSNWHECDAQS